MRKGVSIKRKFCVQRRQSGRRQVYSGEQPTVSAVRVPRIARLLALAIRFDELLNKCVVTDQAELARIMRVTRARVTQILDLANLAPAIQMAILLCNENDRLIQTITERRL